MKTIIGDITEIPSGTIVHQVNCQGAIGGGLSGSIIRKYPEVMEKYYEAIKDIPKNELLGLIQEVTVSHDLTIINLFTQFDFGNAYVDGECYTDMKLLISKLHDICEIHKDVYIPDHLGCGLAGGDWEELKDGIKDLDITVVKLK